MLGHRQAAAIMVMGTLMWSSAGLVTTLLQGAHGFGMTHGRSLFCALALLLIISLWKGPGYLVRETRNAGWMVWASGCCWASMFTLYMLAFSMAPVANVLITLSLEPLLSGLLGWIELGTRIPVRTWVAIVIAGSGMAWIFLAELDTSHFWGTVLALGVPLAAATNWMLMQYGRQQQREMLPALFLGASLCALITWPFSGGWTIYPQDVLLLALLGIFQLALPCSLALVASRRLPAHELALLAMMEILFGILWVALWTGEAPKHQVIQGGFIVLLALLVNEWLAAKRG